MPNKYEELREVVQGGRLLTASRKDLERYATIACLPGFAGHFAAHGHQVGDTVRLMLLVRLSEESGRRSFYIALAALAVGIAGVAKTIIG